MNVTAFDVPLGVVITTCADCPPDIGGTVTLQVFWAGQLVGSDLTVEGGHDLPVGAEEVRAGHLDALARRSARTGSARR